MLRIILSSLTTRCNAFSKQALLGAAALTLGTAQLAVSSAHAAPNSEALARKVMSGQTLTNADLRPWPYGGSAQNYAAQPFSPQALANDLPSTGSAGILVYDLTTDQVVFEKNADVTRPIASISKLLTAMVVLDARQSMDEMITLDPVDFVGPKKASSNLRAGDQLNRAELLLATLMKSENPAAKTLARHYPGGYDAFMAAMNDKARSLGMDSAFFGDPTGLDYRNRANPMDLVKLVKAARGYDVIRAFSTTKSYPFSVRGRELKLSNTSYLVRDDVFDIGISKTGYIREAGRCVVMETTVNGNPAVVVVLGAKSSAQRWGDTENLIHWLQRRYRVA